MTTRTHAACVCAFPLLLTAAMAVHAQTHISILWLGNSYICDNGAGIHADQATQNLIDAGRDSGATDIVIDSMAVSCLWAMGLGTHYNDSTSMALVRSGNYTHVVLQGYIRSEDSAYMVNSAASEILHGKLIADEARAVGSIPVVWCAHPRCDATPDMWDYIIDAYQTMADTAEAVFAPVSIAWRAARDSIDGFELYQGDCIHQNKNGIYLNAAMFYCVFTQSSVVGNAENSVGPTIAADTLAFMQQIAWSVYDSVRQANPAPVMPASTVNRLERPCLHVHVDGGACVVGWQGLPLGARLQVLAMDGRVVTQRRVATQTGRIVLADGARRVFAVRAVGPAGALIDRQVLLR